MTTHTVTFYVAIDDNGNFAVHKDSESDAIAELHSNEYGDAPCRTFEFALSLPGPQPTKVDMTLPDVANPRLTVEATVRDSG
jgi:hypothetical protein